MPAPKEKSPKEKAIEWAVGQQANATCRIDPEIVEAIVQALSK